MKLCPNCETPFEEIAGRLHCPDHGWHALNEAGEIIPAAEPTQQEIEAWQAAQADHKNQSHTTDTDGDQAPDLAPEPGEPRTDPGSNLEPGTAAGPSLAVSDKLIYTIALIIGLLVIALAIYGIYRKNRRAVNE